MHRHARALVTIAVVTTLAGVAGAVAVTADLSSAERDFAAVSAPVQSLLSVGVPFCGAVLTYDLHLHGRRRDLPSTLAWAVGLAVGFALVGAIVSAAAVAAFPSHSPQPWGSPVELVLGGVVAQVVAQLTGTGFGLLIRRAVLACLATIVCPLGLWLVLGATAPSSRAWLTPFESARHLLAGTMTTASWLPFLVMVSLWGIALNLAGIHRFRSHQATGGSLPTLDQSSA
ncbi:hypothetical protein [Actinopolymorpha pittospori]